jgi:hypothetical protein
MMAEFGLSWDFNTLIHISGYHRQDKNVIGRLNEELINATRSERFVPWFI